MRRNTRLPEGRSTHAWCVVFIASELCGLLVACLGGTLTGAKRHTRRTLIQFCIDVLAVSVF